MTDTNTTETSGDDAEQILNAQIALSIDAFNATFGQLESEGYHPSAITSASLATFVQLICAASIMAGRSVADVQKTIRESVNFMDEYAVEVFTQMKADQEKEEKSA